MRNQQTDVFAMKKIVLRELTQIEGPAKNGHPQIQTPMHVTGCPCTVTCGAVSCLCAAQ